MDMNASSYLLFLKLLGFLKILKLQQVSIFICSTTLLLGKTVITHLTSGCLILSVITERYISLCAACDPARKRIQVRALRRIRGDVLDADLAGFIVDEECDDVNVVVTQYDDFLSELLDKHAPLKEIDVVERQLNDWMTDDILTLKKICRKKELIWRKNPITINFDIFKRQS